MVAEIQARDRLVVVGNGMVGWHFVNRLVEHGLHRTYAIEVYGAETVPAYDRIRLAEIVSGGRSPNDLQLAQREWYADQDIHLVTGRPITGLDPSRNQIHWEGGSRGYAKLVLATGSRAARLDVPGSDLPCVHTYRDVEDARRLADLMRPGLRVIMVGGGLLGIELAVAMAGRGADVTVLERSPGILVRQLNVVASSLLRRRLEHQGLAIATEARVSHLESSGKGALVHLEDGTIHEADLVVAAIGIRPRDELARAAGLTCSPSGGVIIDRFLRTSAANVYAIGECASFEATVYGLAAPGFRMADVLADRFAGRHDQWFTGFDRGTRLKLAGTDVVTLGAYEGDGEVATWRNASDYRQLVLRRGRLVGATVIGPWEALPRLADAVARQQTVNRRGLRTFGKGGNPLDAASIMDWPAEACVCTCRQVTRGTLGEAVVDGCSSIVALSQATGAGTVCGSCRPLLAELLGQDPDLVRSVRHPVALGGAGLLSIAFAILVLCIDIPYSTTWSGMGLLESWWRDGFASQVTGYTMAGLALLSCVLSLRKRIPFVTWGGIGWWRLAHIVLAWAGAAMLVAHTGWRLGHNLNRSLVLTYLALIALGGIAAMVIAWDHRIRRHAPWARRWLVNAHIAVVWLMVPFLAFHLVEVYRW